MSENVMSGYAPAFPVRFRGYDRAVVDQELFVLRQALEHAQAERDSAVARALASQPAPPPPTSHARTGDSVHSPVSTTIQWLIDTAEQDASTIRRNAEEEAASFVEKAERLLRQRVELIELAQHEAEACRAQASDEARAIVHDALEQANTLLRGLRESEAALREMFTTGDLSHRMPPPRQPEADGVRPPQHALDEPERNDHPQLVHAATDLPAQPRSASAHTESAAQPTAAYSTTAHPDTELAARAQDANSVVEFRPQPRPFPSEPAIADQPQHAPYEAAGYVAPQPAHAESTMGVQPHLTPSDGDFAARQQHGDLNSDLPTQPNQNNLSGRPQSS